MVAFCLRHVMFVVLLSAACGVYVSHSDERGMFMWDEAEYASIGRSVTRGEGFAISGRPNSLRPPVVPLAGAAMMTLTGSTADATLRIAVVGFALLALVALYAAVCRAADRQTARLAVVLLGVCPSFLILTSTFLSEVPYIAFFTPAVLCFHVGLYDDRRFFYVAWVCVALALLTRYTGVLFAPTALLLTAIAYANGGRQNIRSWAFFVAPFVGLLVLVPWLSRQQLTFGDALVGFKAASGQLGAYLPHVRMPWYFYPQILPRMLTGPVVALGVAGMLWGLRSRNRLATTCTIVVLGQMLWFSFYRFKEPRLVASVMPFAACLAALGMTRALPMLWSRLGAWWVVWPAVMAIAVASLLSTTPRIENAAANGYPSFLEAMDDVRERSTPEQVVIGASEPQIHWYADREVRGFGTEEELPHQLAEADWVVFVNFEPGQPRYVAGLANRIRRHHEARTFGNPKKRRGPRTMVAPADLLRAVLLAEP